MKLTEFQLNRIYNMACDAYEASEAHDEQTAQRFAYAIYQSVDILLDKQARTSEGWDIVLCNGLHQPPTPESIERFIESL